MQEITINNKRYRIRTEFLDKKNSSATVKDDIIILRISNRLPFQEKKGHIETLKKGMIKKIMNKPEHSMERDFSKENMISVLGKSYNISIVRHNSNRSSGRLVGQNIFIKMPNMTGAEEEKWCINNLIRRILSRDMQPIVEDLVAELNRKHFNVTVNKVRIKKQSTRWGSCSSNGNINISFRSLFLPQALLEYICVHELAHIIYQNHSKEFWNVVRTALPNYKERIMRIKKAC